MMRSTFTVSSAGPRAALAALLAAVMIVFTMPSASADDRDDLVQQREQNEQEHDDLEHSLEGVKSDLADVYLKLERIKKRLPQARDELDQANEKLAAAEREAASVQNRLEVARAQRTDLEDQIDAAAAEMAQTEEALGAVARSAYRGGHSASMLAVVLTATSADDFVDQYSTMNSAMRNQSQALTDMETLAAVNRNREARLEAVQDRIEELKVQADRAVANAEEARRQAADLVSEIEQLKKKKSARAGELEGLKDKYSNQIEVLESENAKISDRIAEIDAAARERERKRQQEQASRSSSRSSGSSNSGSSGSSGSSASSAGLITPVPGPLHVTSPWGMRNYPFGGWYMHNGVDLHSPCGQAQRAAASGTVVEVNPAPNGTHGNQVMIDHGVIGGSTYVTVYNHMSRFAVSQGQHVSQGQTIGYTGATGLVTGCHVHFEVWKNGSTIDPMGLPGF